MNSGEPAFAPSRSASSCGTTTTRLRARYRTASPITPAFAARQCVHAIDPFRNGPAIGTPCIRQSWRERGVHRTLTNKHRSSAGDQTRFEPDCVPVSRVLKTGSQVLGRHATLADRKSQENSAGKMFRWRGTVACGSVDHPNNTATAGDRGAPKRGTNGNDRAADHHRLVNTMDKNIIIDICPAFTC